MYVALLRQQPPPNAGVLGKTQALAWLSGTEAAELIAQIHTVKHARESAEEMPASHAYMATRHGCVAATAADAQLHRAQGSSARRTSNLALRRCCAMSRERKTGAA